MNENESPLAPEALNHPLTLLDLMAEKNLFLRDFRLKQALGLPPESFALAADVLALDRDVKLPDRR